MEAFWNCVYTCCFPCKLTCNYCDICCTPCCTTLRGCVRYCAGSFTIDGIPKENRGDDRLGDLQEFLEDMKDFQTGDLVLMSGLGWYTQCLKNSRWCHVGIVYRHEPSEFSINENGEIDLSGRFMIDQEESATFTIHKDLRLKNGYYIKNLGLLKLEKNRLIIVNRVEKVKDQNVYDFLDPNNELENAIVNAKHGTIIWNNDQVWIKETIMDAKDRCLGDKQTTNVLVLDTSPSIQARIQGCDLKQADQWAKRYLCRKGYYIGHRALHRRCSEKEWRNIKRDLNERFRKTRDRPWGGIEFTNCKDCTILGHICQCNLCCYYILNCTGDNCCCRAHGTNFDFIFCSEFVSYLIHELRNDDEIRLEDEYFPSDFGDDTGDEFLRKSFSYSRIKYYFNDVRTEKQEKEAVRKWKNEDMHKGIYWPSVEERQNFDDEFPEFSEPKYEVPKFSQPHSTTHLPMHYTIDYTGLGLHADSFSMDDKAKISDEDQKNEKKSPVQKELSQITNTFGDTLRGNRSNDMTKSATNIANEIQSALKSEEFQHPVLV